MAVCASAAKSFGPVETPGCADNWGQPWLMAMTEASERKWVTDNKLRLACFINLVHTE
jgi:hypothetical protein